MRKFLLLCLPLLVALVADWGFTIQGQPRVWWEGNYAFHSELNPIGKWVLSYGPDFTCLAVAIYAWLCCVFILATPPRIAAMICTGLTVGHTIGWHSWCESFNAARIAILATCILSLCTSEFLISEIKETK